MSIYVNLMFNHNKHGFCLIHRILGKQIEVSKSTWKDRGGGKGSGFIKSKVKKFICPDKNRLPEVPIIAPMVNNHATSPISRHVAGQENQGTDSRIFYLGISENAAASGGKD